MSKGSTPRPIGIPKEQYRSNYDAIFGKKKPLPPPSQGGNSQPAK